jgi:ATP adenylyltransferase/5',5'''-P-1,P-4-tetraphosphate phosphorylase II
MSNSVNLDDIIISKRALHLSENSSLDEMADALQVQQRGVWPLYDDNAKGLEQVQVKTFHYAQCNVKVQFNPARIKSSAAKVDNKSIKERKCFLCTDALPPKQKGIPFNDEYLVLVNPYPIFPRHLTIPRLEHAPQFIEPYFRDMLELSRALKSYTVFYNGPKCGASAPDHMHFQAGNKGFLPVETEYSKLKATTDRKLFSNEHLEIFAVSNYLRKFIAIESDEMTLLQTAFEWLYELLEQRGQEPEPMLNILSGYENGKWRVLVFPRDKHRPDQYFAEGDENILLSPASVDFGGVCITPQEKDFKKIKAADLIDIFAQVSVTDSYFDELCAAYAKRVVE